MARAKAATFWVIPIILTAVTGVTLGYMQTRFDAADLRNATNLVRSYDGGRGPTVEDIVRSQEPGAHLTWDSAVRSGCLGWVRVRCRAEGARRTVTYLWDVDMGTVSIHPANAVGRRVLANLERPRARGGAS